MAYLGIVRSIGDTSELVKQEQGTSMNPVAPYTKSSTIWSYNMVAIVGDSWVRILKLLTFKSFYFVIAIKHVLKWSKTSKIGQGDSTIFLKNVTKRSSLGSWNFAEKKVAAVVVVSVTRLGYFSKFMTINFHAKVAQIFGGYLGCFGKWYHLSKICRGYFLGNNWKHWVPFNFNIWSHWSSLSSS